MTGGDFSLAYNGEEYRMPDHPEVKRLISAMAHQHLGENDWRKASISVFPLPGSHGDVHTFHVCRSNGDSLTVAEYAAIFAFATGHPIDESQLAHDSKMFAPEDR